MKWVWLGPLARQPKLSKSMSLAHLSLNRDRYVSLLEKLIGETEYLQDNPPKFIPQEDRYAVIRLG